MPVVSSQYWNQVHGLQPEDVEKGLEGLQTMRTLASNMAWLLKCIPGTKGNTDGVDDQHHHIGSGIESIAEAVAKDIPKRNICLYFYVLNLSKHIKPATFRVGF